MIYSSALLGQNYKSIVLRSIGLSQAKAMLLFLGLASAMSLSVVSSNIRHKMGLKLADCTRCDKSANFECTNCIIHKLKQKIFNLEAMVKNLTKRENDNLKSIGAYQIAQYEKDIKEHHNCDFLGVEPLYKLCEPQYQFLTITFDPSMFGEFNEPEREKQYILFYLYKCIKQNFFSSFMGCFEHQNRGAIHAHVAVDLKVNYKEVYKYLKPHFTCNPYNRNAIDFGKKQLFNGWVCYLNGCTKGDLKTDHIFTYKIESQYIITRNNPLDDNL